MRTPQGYLPMQMDGIDILSEVPDPASDFTKARLLPDCSCRRHQHAHQGFALSRFSPFVGHLSQVVTEAVLYEFFNSVGLTSYSCRLCRHIRSADGTGA